jgi:quercetin dioxygenase-like cupin family protein
MAQQKKEPLASAEEHRRRITRWEEVPDVSLGPGLHMHICTAENMTAIFTNLEPNSVVPHHRHDPEQIMIVMEGSGEQVVLGKRYKVKAGDYIVVPAGSEHALYVGPKGIRTIEVFSPPRHDYEAKLAEVMKAKKK